LGQNWLQLGPRER